LLPHGGCACGKTSIDVMLLRASDPGTGIEDGTRWTSFPTKAAADEDAEAAGQLNKRQGKWEMAALVDGRAAGAEGRRDVARPLPCRGLDF
jgi:hypothetical protein